MALEEEEDRAAAAEEEEEQYGEREDDEEEQALPSAAPATSSKDGKPESATEGEKKKKKKKLPPIRINLANCKYEVLRIVQRKMGWKEVGDDEDWEIYWTDTSVGIDRIMKLTKTQKINHFNGMLELCRKRLMARNLQKMQKVFPEHYDFFPQTFILPHDQTALEADMKARGKKQIYILKPDAGCQGRGIKLVQGGKEETLKQTLADMATTNIVAQHYLPKPYLIHGFKFDLRIYALVLSCDPLRLFVFREGLARICTEKYSKPKASNLNVSFMHLTNYAVNKKNENFVQNQTGGDEDDESASKLGLEQLAHYIEAQGHSWDQAWKSIHQLIVKSIISVQPILKNNYRSAVSIDNDGFSCFEIIGYDIMLDEALRPWLIECNHSSSFSVDSPLDLAIKEALITDTLQLVRVDPKLIQKARKLEKKVATGRLTGAPGTPLAKKKSVHDLGKAADDDADDGGKGKDGGPSGGSDAAVLFRPKTVEELEAWRESILRDREKYEAKNLGGFTRIYPVEDPELQGHYDTLLRGANEVYGMAFKARRPNAAESPAEERKKREESEPDSVKAEKARARAHRDRLAQMALERRKLKAQFRAEQSAAHHSVYPGTPEWPGFSPGMPGRLGGFAGAVPLSAGLAGYACGDGALVPPWSAGALDSEPYASELYAQEIYGEDSCYYDASSQSRPASASSSVCGTAGRGTDSAAQYRDDLYQEVLRSQARRSSLTLLHRVNSGEMLPGASSLAARPATTANTTHNHNTNGASAPAGFLARRPQSASEPPPIDGAGPVALEWRVPGSVRAAASGSTFYREAAVPVDDSPGSLQTGLKGSRLATKIHAPGSARDPSAGQWAGGASHAAGKAVHAPAGGGAVGPQQVAPGGQPAAPPGPATYAQHAALLSKHVSALSGELADDAVGAQLARAWSSGADPGPGAAASAGLSIAPGLTAGPAPSSIRNKLRPPPAPAGPAEASPRLSCGSGGGAAAAHGGHAPASAHAAAPASAGTAAQGHHVAGGSAPGAYAAAEGPVRAATPAELQLMMQHRGGGVGLPDLLVANGHVASMMHSQGGASYDPSSWSKDMYMAGIFGSSGAQYVPGGQYAAARQQHRPKSASLQAKAKGAAGARPTTSQGTHHGLVGPKSGGAAANASAAPLSPTRSMLRSAPPGPLSKDPPVLVTSLTHKAVPSAGAGAPGTSRYVKQALDSAFMSTASPASPGPGSRALLKDEPTSFSKRLAAVTSAAMAELAGSGRIAYAQAMFAGGSGPSSPLKTARSGSGIALAPASMAGGLGGGHSGGGGGGPYQRPGSASRPAAPLSAGADGRPKAAYVLLDVDSPAGPLAGPGAAFGLAARAAALDRPLAVTGRKMK